MQMYVLVVFFLEKKHALFGLVSYFKIPLLSQTFVVIPNKKSYVFPVPVGSGQTRPWRWKKQIQTSGRCPWDKFLQKHQIQLFSAMPICHLFSHKNDLPSSRDAHRMMMMNELLLLATNGLRKLLKTSTRTEKSLGENSTWFEGSRDLGYYCNYLPWKRWECSLFCCFIYFVNSRAYNHV